MNHIILFFADATTTSQAPLFSDAVWNNLINSIVAIVMAWIAYRQHDEKTKADARDVKIGEVADTVKVVSDQVQGVHDLTNGMKSELVQAAKDIGVANTDAAIAQGELNTRAAFDQGVKSEQRNPSNLNGS